MLELQWLYVIYILDKGVRIAHFSEFLHGFSGVWKSVSNWIRKVRLEKAAICNAKTKTTIVVQHLGVRITMVVSFGGGWWIRTTEGIASRFTVCPLWPLGKSPIFIFRSLEPVDGLEPPTYWLQISCSTNWAIPAAQTEHAYYSTRIEFVKNFL